ncbi:MAG: 3-isopropylmalate/(R)-2-methylmalate dehydratase large subunit [Chloroflexota bacterium]|jgi:3-isopropylmalate/(R)-2-methylmalate dehydratase large subunit|nr:3-isopropylmalate/(R)-2-methylmalate dehydratase large subunit [Chloroflexota bacterium]
MGHTIVEKIIAAHAGRDEVSANDFVDVSVDWVMANDITAPLAIMEFHKLGVERVFNNERVVLVGSHFVPAKDIAAAQNMKDMREFAKEQGIVHFFEPGKGGIEHALMPQEGITAPGEFLLGADSHTNTGGALQCLAAGFGSTDCAIAMATGKTWLKVPPTIKVNFVGKRKPYVTGKDFILRLIGEIGVEGANYQSLEFHGEAIHDLTVFERFTMANMTTEAQAKCGLFPVDEEVLEYVRGKVNRPFNTYEADPDAQYVREVTIDVTNMEPQIAVPFLPDNTSTVWEQSGTEVDQVFIGSCTNGWLPDIRLAARIMRGRKVAPNLRAVVIPATQQIYVDALKEGLVEVFAEAGAAMSAGTCGPCLGGYFGVLASGEKAVSTSNRNFRGRMGHRDAEVYLASPMMAAATAVLGHIPSQDELDDLLKEEVTA